MVRFEGLFDGSRQRRMSVDTHDGIGPALALPVALVEQSPAVVLPPAPAASTLYI
jgi:hypothetical protein